MNHSLHEVLDFSHNRSVFVVGDIHGEFRKLDKKLQDVGFSAEEGDILISVGDLVDRGPFSHEFETYLNKPWFYRVRGNHDDQPREYLLGYESADNVARNGGQWLLDKSRNEIERIASILEDAPVALTVMTPKGFRVGVTHADCLHRWDWLVDQCQDRDLERYIINLLTGSRESIELAQKKPDAPQLRVEMIDHVFHGHTPVERPLTAGNQTWLDTQINNDAPLTVLHVDDWVLHHIYH